MSLNIARPGARARLRGSESVDGRPAEDDRDADDETRRSCRSWGFVVEVY